jgi:hypothetical protein
MLEIFALYLTPFEKCLQDRVRSFLLFKGKKEKWNEHVSVEWPCPLQSF